MGAINQRAIGIKLNALLTMFARAGMAGTKRRKSLGREDN
jgi:hypothetical protein